VGSSEEDREKDGFEKMGKVRDLVTRCQFDLVFCGSLWGKICEIDLKEVNECSIFDRSIRDFVVFHIGALVDECCIHWDSGSPDDNHLDHIQRNLEFLSFMFSGTETLVHGTYYPHCRSATPVHNPSTNPAYTPPAPGTERTLYI
jgi:hypothetical protein